MQHVYLRWYENGKPRTGPLLMVSENAAKATVLEKFPQATFSQRKKTAHEPTTYTLSGVDEVILAWPEPRTPELKAVADILFPIC